MRKYLVLALALLAGALFSSDAQAQQRRITGRVTAAGSGEALGNAAVNVVGTAIGTYTAEDGSFQLLVPPTDVSLLVRRVGYKRNTARVSAAQSEANIPLERDVLQLEAQVITGQATTVSTVNAANAVTVVSSEALAVAMDNAQRHGVWDRVEFIATSYLGGVEGDFDLIAANPPYVRDRDKAALGRPVRHEPEVALFGGDSGLRDIEGVLDTAIVKLRPHAWLVMEF